MVEQVADIATHTCEIVVDAQHLAPLPQQNGAEMGSNKSSATGDEDPLAHFSLRSYRESNGLALTRAVQNLTPLANA